LFITKKFWSHPSSWTNIIGQVGPSGPNALARVRNPSFPVRLTIPIEWSTVSCQSFSSISSCIGFFLSGL
jgi:hypothetical protein